VLGLEQLSGDLSIPLPVRREAGDLGLQSINFIRNCSVRTSTALVP
jgi:hypothetical protein